MTDKGARWAGWFAVSFLAAAAFLPTLHNGFVWDDHLILGKIGALAGPLPAFTQMYSVGAEQTPYYRPIALAAFSLSWRLFGANPFGYHALNVLLHALVSGVVFLICRRLLPPLPAMLAAVLFAVHPVHVEAVSFVSSGPNDLLSTLLFLGAVLALLPTGEGRRRSEPSGSAPLWLAAALSLLASLTKEATLLLPALVPVVIRYRPGASLKERFAAAGVALLPFSLAPLAYAALRSLAAGSGGLAASPDTLHASVSQQLAVIFHVFRLLFFPRTLVPFYDLWPVSRFEIAGGCLALALASWLVFSLGRVRRWDLPWRLGAALFAVTLAPALPVFPRAGALIAERFLYLPSVGFVLLAGCALDLAVRPGAREAIRRGVLAALCVAVPLLLVWSAARSRDWRDDVTLFSRGLERDPGNGGLHYLLGTEYFHLGSLADAERSLRLSLESHPGFESAEYKLAELYRVTGRADAAGSMFRAIIGRNPLSAKAHFGLGSVEMDHGSLELAQRELSESLRLDPSSALAAINLGVVFYRKGDFAAARTAWSRGLQFDPANPILRENLESLAKARR